MTRTKASANRNVVSTRLSTKILYLRKILCLRPRTLLPENLSRIQIHTLNVPRPYRSRSRVQYCAACSFSNSIESKKFKKILSRVVFKKDDEFSNISRNFTVTGCEYWPIYFFFLAENVNRASVDRWSTYLESGRFVLDLSRTVLPSDDL